MHVYSYQELKIMIDELVDQKSKYKPLSCKLSHENSLVVRPVFSIINLYYSNALLFKICPVYSMILFEENEELTLSINQSLRLGCYA